MCVHAQKASPMCSVQNLLNQLIKFSDFEAEGNCMRFFALQNVGAKAVRMKIATHHEDFKTIWKRFEIKCRNQYKIYKG